MSTPLIKEFVYNVTAEIVWRALTHTPSMKRWYFLQLQKFEPVVGAKFQFEDNNSAYQKEWTVTHVVDGRLLAHSWAYKGYAGQSEVIFELISEGKRTRLKVTHTNLESFPDDSHFKRERFESGWDTLLGHNLKRLLEADAKW
jgi:uncharacterized protein YndB with AHSA1/START domain